MELGTSDDLQFQSLRERKCELVVARQIAPQPDMDAEVLFQEQSFVWVGQHNYGLPAEGHGETIAKQEPAHSSLSEIM